MKNPIPTKREAVFGLAENMADGLNRYSTELGVVLITQTLLRDKVLAAEAAIRGYDEAVAAKTAAYAVQSVADEEGRRFLRGLRNLLAVSFGELYSPAWTLTGFPDNSTAIPSTLDGRQALLRSLHIFLGNHPDHEHAEMNITAIRAGELFNALSDARSAVNNAIDEAASRKRIRDEAIDVLRHKMRGCIDELNQLMPADDSRWYSFGLNPPAAPDSPEAVDDVVLTHGGTGIVIVPHADGVIASRNRSWVWTASSCRWIQRRKRNLSSPV